ncbi:gamma-glutamylcyclotransferase [Pseudomonadota bacterium]
MDTPRGCPDLPDGDLWVFGYGSLMWQPGFEHVEAVPARVYGYQRALCLWSTVYRGTPENPGLVFGLTAGGSCLGRAFRVREPDKEAVLRYLWQREMIRRAYVPSVLGLHIGGEVKPGLAFVVDTGHPQFAENLSDELTARIISRSRGRGGPNLEYFLGSLDHLDEMGVCTRRYRNIRRRLCGEQPSD